MRDAALTLRNFTGITFREFFDVMETGEKRATRITFDDTDAGTSTLYMETYRHHNLVPVQITSVTNGLLKG